MSDSNVERALMKAAQEFLTTGDEPILESSEISWENVKFKHSSATTWAAVFYRPIAPEARTIGWQGFDEAMGFIQIDINVPVDTGTAIFKDWEDKARNVFAPGNDFEFGSNYVNITKTGMLQGRVVENDYRRSIQINFKSHIKRQNPITN